MFLLARECHAGQHAARLTTVPHSRGLHGLVHLVTAALLSLAACVPAVVPDLALTFFGWSRWLLATAAVVALLAALTWRPLLARPSMAACVLISALVLGLAALEVLFRALRYDFDRTEAGLRRLPPFFRKPLVPSGTVFYRRAGPESWTGRPLHALMEVCRVRPSPYTNEAVITVNYDALGFRNETDLADWEIAVAGDSFTELGHLPFGQLFTTRLGELLGVRVRNFGVSHTGPLTQLHYLEAFGLAASTREVLIVFYEGNDLADLAYESAALEEFAVTGRRPKRGRRPQTSFVRALHEKLIRRSLEPPAFPAVANAWFDGASGPEAVTISTPPGKADEMPARTREALDALLRQYAAFSREHRVAARLVYLPTKETVLRGMLVTGDGTPEGWQESARTDLPAYVASRCAEAGIPFLDLTEALITETQARRRLLFSGMYDTHLNAHGAAVVARELAGSETGTAGRIRRAAQSAPRKRRAPGGT